MFGRLGMRVSDGAQVRAWGRHLDGWTAVPDEGLAAVDWLKRQAMKKVIALSIAVLTMVAFSARAADGKALYDKDCAKCHGADGKGQTKMGQKLGCKDYTDPKVQADLKDDAAVKAIKEGFTNSDGKKVMRAAGGISDEDAKALVAYMRTFKK